jgi:hypothetical protein
MFGPASVAIMIGTVALVPGGAGGNAPARVPDMARAANAAAAAVPASANSFSTSGYLVSVAALSRADAWAVGSTGNTTIGNTYRTLIVHWNGTKWSPVANPKPVFGYLQGIAAAAPDDVWAVGVTTTSTGTNPHVLIMHWNGKVWSRAPGVPGLKGVLAAVTVEGSEVWAVGGTLVNPLLVLHRIGGRWYVVPTSSPIASLAGVAATGHDSAWAGGVTFSPSGGKYNGDLLLHWNGSTWRPVNFPLRGAYDGLFGMAASPGGAVWAVGGSRNSAYSSVSPLSMLWNGKNWRKVPVSAPANSQLAGVGFVPGGGFWAAGTRTLGLDTLVLHWTGKAWAQIPSPDPYGGVNQVDAVAGTSASDVWAVGGGTATLSTTDHPLTIILHWNGKTWN